jgi:hypothetical protein
VNTLVKEKLEKFRVQAKLRQTMKHKRLEKKNKKIKKKE